MARKKKNTEDENVGKSWTEGELIQKFSLVPILDRQTFLMKEWLDTPELIFNSNEQYIFDKTLKKAVLGIKGWNEEDLKVKFLSYILDLGGMTEDKAPILSYFDKLIGETVEGIPLKVKADFMLAKGVFDYHQEPYFHFQEYKPQLNPTGDSMAQLIEAFLIGQKKNKHKLPLYGAEVVGAIWKFVIMEGKDYCISKSFDSTDREDLLKIIAILRKFRHILETRLLVNETKKD